MKIYSNLDGTERKEVLDVLNQLHTLFESELALVLSEVLMVSALKMNEVEPAELAHMCGDVLEVSGVTLKSIKEMEKENDV